MRARPNPGRRSRGEATRVPLAVLFVLLTLGSVLPASAAAAVEVPFAARFAANLRGDFTVAANTLMSCPDEAGLGAECIASRAGLGSGTALNNNNYEMELVDADADAGSFDSSSATLTLPPGATVRFAGLYYGARTSKGEGPKGLAAPSPAARGTVLLQPPGASGYTSLSAVVTDSTAITAAYTGFVDVTAIVAAAGAGSYAVANVQTGTGKDRYAGWSLVVAYADSAAPPRSIRVYDGLASIQSNQALQIAVTGLETPPAGPVSANVGVVAYEGDRGSGGDRLSFGGKPLFDAASPETNVFNSSIATRGVNVTTKTPNYVNQLGFDANVLSADGYLGNDATAAVLEESTTVEQYLTQVVAIGVELDPAVLEPPPAPAPPSPPAPAPSPTPPKGPGKSKPKDPVEPPKLSLDLDAPAMVRPEQVVRIAVTLEAEGERATRGIEVCSRTPEGLELLRAPAAETAGNTACWTIPKLAPGRSRTFVLTARVGALGGRILTATAVVRADNARTRRGRFGLLVRPLPESACRARLGGGPLATASC